MNPCGDWESVDDIQARLSAENVIATPDQWARWRGHGFLPEVRQSGLGQGAGSVVRYSTGSADQIIKVAGLFRIKEKASFVGWELWWSGDDVADKWWRPTIEQAAQSWRRSIRLIDRVVEKDELDETRTDTIFDRIPASFTDQQPLSQALRSIAKSEVPTFLGIIADVALRRFEGDDALQVAGERSGLEIARDGMGMRGSTDDAILGKKLRFTEALPGVLRAMARMPKLPDTSRLFAGENLRLLNAARDDARNAFATITAFRRAVCWIYGRNAFGLGLAGWLADKSSPTVKATLVLGLMQLRRASNELLSSEEIADLRTIAERGLAQSMALRQLIQSHPSSRKLLNPKRLKLALSSEKHLAIYQAELSQLQLAKV